MARPPLPRQQTPTPPNDSIRYIALTQGKYAVIDAEDYEFISQWVWFAHYQARAKKWYAARSTWDGKRRGREYMHRKLFDLSGEIEIDHIDGDGLNNRRSSNLRIATHQQNLSNQLPRCTNTSGYRGVTLHKKTGKWLAQIKVNYQHHYLGLFTDAKLAAQTYNDAAVKYFGDFAVLNQI